MNWPASKFETEEPTKEFTASLEHKNDEKIQSIEHTLARIPNFFDNCGCSTLRCHSTLAMLMGTSKGYGDYFGEGKYQVSRLYIQLSRRISRQETRKMKRFISSTSSAPEFQVSKLESNR